MFSHHFHNFRCTRHYKSSWPILVNEMLNPLIYCHLLPKIKLWRHCENIEFLFPIFAWGPIPHRPAHLMMGNYLSLGSLIFNPMNAWLTEHFGFRVAFRCAAGIIFFIGVLCCGSYSANTTSSSGQILIEHEVSNQQASSSRQSRIEDEISSEQENQKDRMHSSQPDDKTEANFTESSSACRLTRTLRSWSHCTDIRQRPEIILWYLGNGTSYVGFSMPFMILVSGQPNDDFVQSVGLLCLRLL